MAATAPVIRHAIQWLADHGEAPSQVCCIYAAAPLMMPEDLQRGFALLQEATGRGEADALAFAASGFAHPPQRGFTLGSEQRVTMHSPELAVKRTQDLDPWYHDVGMFYFGTPESWASDAILAKPNRYAVLIPKARAVDIDDKEDWEFAEAAYEVFRRKSKAMRAPAASTSTKAANADTLAVHGGEPIRSTLLPYGRQSIEEADVQAVIECLYADYLTTGPKVSEFEEATCKYVGTKHAIAVCNGTAALHCAAFAAGVGPGDEVIVSNVTFVASSNAVLYMGAKVVFCDVEKDTLNIDVSLVEALVTPRTKAIVAVDMCGQPPDLDELRRICTKHRLVLIEDASHAIGATYKGQMIGSIADITTFSFHPVKNITTGEGGMVVTNREDFAQRARSFRAHGIDLDYRTREKQPVPHRYDMNALGYNYRITDIQCALGIKQLERIDHFIQRRQEIAKLYFDAFADVPGVSMLVDRADRTNAHHLCVMRLDLAQFTADRDEIFKALRKENIGVNVHYMPVHMHSFYRDSLKFSEDLCPQARAVYQEIISLPCFPKMTDEDVKDVVRAVSKVSAHFRPSDAKRARLA
eukprot:SRR837773.22809.p1 GENE.SRR837773.22809~~SRR837773.22809.p1  ORF type:complete len:629 (+),score=180.02 SRR837773.22809:144-1889(+)